MMKRDKLVEHFETNILGEIVGQDAAKKKLRYEYEKSFVGRGLMGNYLFAGGKGKGKSKLAVALAKALVQCDEDGNPLTKADGKTPLPRAFIEVNAAAIKTPAQFVNSLLIPEVIDKEVTVFIDEASEIPHKIVMMMLSMLNPNETNKTSYKDVSTGYTIDIDFSRQTFLFATTDAQKINDALRERLERVDLASYTFGQLGEIISRACKGIKIDDDVLAEMTTTLRGSPRQAIRCTKRIQAGVNRKDVFGRKEWKELQEALAILPYGLSEIEMQVMNLCFQNPDGSTLTNLAAKTGISREAIQKDYEMYPQMLGFYEITAGKGRTLTAQGTQFLRDFHAGKPVMEMAAQEMLKKPLTV